MTLRESAEHQRARFAWEQIEAWDGERPLEKVETRLKGLPVALRTQGLTVALATLLRENRGESTAIARCLVQWLQSKDNPFRLLKVAEPPPGRETSQATRLLGEMTRLDRSTYLAVQTDALGLCEMLKLLSAARVAGRKPAGKETEQKDSEGAT